VGCGEVATPPVDAPVDPGSLLNGCALLEHMDEPAWTGTAGEVGDACGGDDNGTALGGITTVDGGVRGRAGSFDGNGCIEVEDAASLHASTGLTISAWINPSGLDGVNALGIVSKRTDENTDEAYSVYAWEGDVVWVNLDGEDSRFMGKVGLENGTWSQVTMVYDGTKDIQQRASVFIDGGLDVTSGEASAALPAATSLLHVGCLPSSIAVQNFKGLIDEVAIWTRPLSGAEVAAWHDMTKP